MISRDGCWRLAVLPVPCAVAGDSNLNDQTYLHAIKRMHKHKTDRSVSEVLLNVDKEFHEIVSSEEVFRKTTEKFLDNVVDMLILGVVHEVHRNVKCGFVNLDEYLKPESSGQREKMPPLIDIFSHYSYKMQKHECLCRLCNKFVLAKQ